MLTTFGAFWAGEGVGVDWVAGDATLIELFVLLTVASLAAVSLVRRQLQAMPQMSADPSAKGT
jgi:uncharacterized membrane protein